MDSLKENTTVDELEQDYLETNLAKGMENKIKHNINMSLQLLK